MTDFDRRWQALVAAARKAPVHRGALTDVHAARLAAQGFAFARQARAAKVDANSAWRGMALAASLFLACLIGSGGVAMIFYPEVNTHLAMHLSTVPSTSFIPAPPRPLCRSGSRSTGPSMPGSV